MELPPDPESLRRIVDAADLNALRAAVYQATQDPELAAFGPVPTLSADEAAKLREVLHDRLAVEWPEAPSTPPDDALLRSVMDVTLGVSTSPGDFVLRKKFLAFESHPFAHRPESGKPVVPEDFSVAIVGAGFSGIAMAVQLELLGIPYRLYERRDEVGGTWSRNRYPDIRVDTLSMTYELSLESPHRWTEYFARGPEVRGYLDAVAERYGVREKIHVDHALAEARFDEASATWGLVFDRSDGTQVETRANVVISAAGLFTRPTMPSLPGADDFEGEILHPTEWSPERSAAGLRVAVVGNGSTGVQLLAPVAEAADQVHVFQRTPQWISPRPNYGRPIEPEIQWLFDHLPGYWNWYRYTSIINLFTWHEDFLVPDDDYEREGGRITRKSDELRGFLVDYIRSEIGDRPDLLERLVPDYAPMVRRPVVDNGWYRALTRDDVELVTEPIARLVPKGIETADGKVREVDLLIMATGYAVDQYLWPAEYYGEGGANLRDFWAPESPRAYLGMMVPKFPNLFVMYGPNSQPVAGGVSLPSWMQIWAAYAAQCLCTMFEEGHARVRVTDEAFRAFNERLDAMASTLAFVRDEGSVEKNYYVDAAGRLLVNTPFETADLYPMMETPDRDEVVFD